MNSNRSEYGFAALALAFLTGGLIGVAAGLLFAPRPGTETRERIKERAEEARDRLRGTAETVRDRAETWAETGKEKFSEVRDKVRESMEKVKEKVAGKKEEQSGAEA